MGTLNFEGKSTGFLLSLEAWRFAPCARSSVGLHYWQTQTFIPFCLNCNREAADVLDVPVSEKGPNYLKRMRFVQNVAVLRQKGFGLANEA